MAPRRAKVNKFDYKKLSANDVICPICRSILIKPITLPCSHGFCSSCFETTTQNANVVCPLCRVRVGSWLRSTSKSKKLINETFWQAIQDSFPIEVKNKLNEGVKTRGDNYEVKNSRESNTKRNTKLIPNMRHEDSQKVQCNNLLKTENTQTQPVSSLASTSTGFLPKSRSNVNTVSKNNNKTVLVNSDKSDNSLNFRNNFATKEYTCRILCQDASSKETQKSTNESQTLIQKKNKRIQELTESEMSNDRSNSIESECLYFKPIDYRHNPPSEGLAPIKVPTRKPNVSPHIKILAPSGQNQININHLESAFARLCSPASIDGKIDLCKKENIDSHVQEDNSVQSIKRKNDKSENKAKKKIKTIHRPGENQSIKSKESIKASLINVCDINQSKMKEDSINSNNVKKISSIKPQTEKLTNEDIKRSLQVQADFELAKKLQQTYNQSLKYSTRSSVLKRMASKNQVTMEGLMTPYKVK